MHNKKIINNENKKTVVHGSNYREYLIDLSIGFKVELDERIKAIKPKVLKFTTDDAGDCDFFLEVFGKFIKYNTDTDKYYYWTGRLWREDNENRMALWAQTAMRYRRDYTLKKLKKKSSVKNGEQLKKFANGCCNQRSIKAVIEGCKSLVACKDTIFDTKSHLLNVLNGTVDLRNGVLKPHKLENYITKMCPFMYSEGVKSELFKKFLKQTFEDNSLIDYVQRLLGYCITGETKEQVVHFFVGNGANGKSTLLSLVQHILNEYAGVIPAKVLTSIEKAGAASSEIAQLPHKRMVCCSELNCSDALNEAKIKVMSSGETLPTRQLYGKSFTYTPEFKTIIDTNYLPQISGTDHGIWRRIRVVPFEYTVPKEKINKNLLSQLKLDSRAVLSWLVEGAVKYYDEGLGTCDEVDKATKRYRRAQDTLGGFIDACIRTCEGSEVRARTLYEEYLAYCNDNLLSPMSETKFGRDFSTRGFVRSKDKVSRKYVGIKLKK